MKTYTFEEAIKLAEELFFEDEKFKSVFNSRVIYTLTIWEFITGKNEGISFILPFSIFKKKLNGSKVFIATSFSNMLNKNFPLFRFSIMMRKSSGSFSFRLVIKGEELEIMKFTFKSFLYNSRRMMLENYLVIKNSLIKKVNIPISTFQDPRNLLIFYNTFITDFKCEYICYESYLKILLDLICERFPRDRQLAYSVIYPKLTKRT